VVGIASALVLGLGATQAHATAVPIVFDLTGHLSLASSANFSSGGLDLTVTAGVFDQNNEIINGASALVFGSPFGVGVASAYFDIPLIDGRGHNEVALLHFSEEVSLSSITFTFADGNDDFLLFVGDSMGMPIVQGPRIGLGPTSGGISVFAFSDAWLSDLFGIGARDKNDEFLIKAVSVLANPGGTSPVPLPAPVLMLGSVLLLGGFVSYRRKRRPVS
jgi:hypothetical protein